MGGGRSGGLRDPGRGRRGGGGAKNSCQPSRGCEFFLEKPILQWSDFTGCAPPLPFFQQCAYMFIDAVKKPLFILITGYFSLALYLINWVKRVHPGMISHVLSTGTKHHPQIKITCKSNTVIIPFLSTLMKTRHFWVMFHPKIKLY